ncbi:hypothetical protein Tco_0909622 [Tanacetum coccineum]|uniref:Uncharacterized protein n=1 Tax=Tanacetum coccineum TaxID=301880 RepID=A0ABQ5CSH7_9ASTR
MFVIHWRPTGRTFTLSDQCPLTRFTKLTGMSAIACANQSEPNQHWGSNFPNSPSSVSFLKMRSTNHPLFIGIVRFGNDHFCAIMGYEDYVIGDSVNLQGPFVSIAIDLNAPSGSHTSSPLDHHSSSVHHGLADYNSKASSSGEITIPESSQSTQHHEHVRKWTDSHPLDNIIRNPSRPVSTRKQLATDALWCFYNSVLSKVELKNFQFAATEDCWFQTMQMKIHEFDFRRRME